jgi:ribulose-5-phosphate 4-epimerase/fuculose-1-phosphate aldolase
LSSVKKKANESRQRLEHKINPSFWETTGSTTALFTNSRLLTVGQTVDEAAYRHIIMERTCQAQLLAEAAAANGIPKRIISDLDAQYTADALSEPVHPLIRR